jgi:peptidoglycan glycosyltransferase
MGSRKVKKHILACAVFMLICFAALMLRVVWLQTVEADGLAHNSLNQRSTVNETSIVRGNILDINGKKLAESHKPGERAYPMGKIMAPVTGYTGDKIGSTGIEGTANGDLLGMSVGLSKLGPVAQLFQSDHGNDVKLTIDARVQEAAYDALGDRRGAVVMLDAATGAVMAMVSRPSFNPNSIEADWDSLRKADDSPLLNRALQGLYPPGSTLKPLIADAALAGQVTDLSEIFNCTGTLDVGGGQTIRESHGEVHGKVNLEKALVESCNVTFGTLAMRLGDKKLGTAFDRFGFNKSAEGEIKEAANHLPDFAKLGQGDTAQVGIGQSSLLVTPLHMALLASAFADHGVVMKPYLIDEVISPKGVIIKRGSAEKWFEATTPDRAAVIDGFMEQVVAKGTGTAARVKGIRVTGKTGTAENAGGRDHAWFIGSAEISGKKVAFAIIVENSGGGGTEAAPIARDIIMSLLKQ